MIVCDGVLFDLDGTLWDATEGIALSWGQVLSQEPDIPRPPTRQELEGVMGMTSAQLMATLFPQLSPQRGQALFAKCCAAEDAYLLAHGGRLYPGIPQTLEALSARWPLAIISNCGPTYIPTFLQAHRLAPFFADWECIGRTGLEKWENIRLVVQRLGLRRPVYVGDTSLDCQAAQRAGVPFIHAAYGFGQAPDCPSISAPAALLPLLGLPPLSPL